MGIDKVYFLIGTTLLFCMIGTSAEKTLPREGLVLDLDASVGVEQDAGHITRWNNQAPDIAAEAFVHRDQGRKQAGSGRPTHRASVPELNAKPSIVFRQQELVCMDEDAFDGLTTGKGNTWIAIICVYKQRVGLKDVNSFFGNLRNGARYEGLWACVDDKNGLWYGARNGLTFGRFDKNNPKISGPKLEIDRYYLVAGRMGSGTGLVTAELFVNTATPVATSAFPVQPDANPSKMAVGQERDAIEHPGKESFDGEIARLLIWQRPLTNTELATTIKELTTSYGVSTK